MRLPLAPTFALTDARGHNEKGRPDSVAASGATHGEHWLKPTGASAQHSRQSRLQRIRVTGHMKLASTLSPRSLGNARTGLTMNTLPFEKQIQVISALTEGCSIRSTERLTDVNRNTVMSLSLRVGDGCERLHDSLMRDLQVNQIELDEQWDFIQKKQKRVQTGDPSEFGDVWLFVALASTQKAVLSYLVGKRSTENTNALARDLRGRIVNRPQITSDGYAPYVGAVEAAFGWNVDYAMLTKQYVGDSNLPDAAHRYSPGHVAGIEKTVIRGRPDEDLISTSYVERFNLSAGCRCAGSLASATDSRKSSRATAQPSRCG